ncbi:MAG: MFS transporter [Spirochaetaceae bacterium]|jgi:HEAT repeat protein|nr:MFS transporter [Spirochaetaceae bacterium]
MASTLSPYRLGKARELYNIFNVFNALSWSFLVGNIITLFAMRLRASATYIGVISALLYVSFFFLPLGKLLTRRFRITRIFSFAWIGRALGMTPLLLVPYLVSKGNTAMAMKIVLLGVAIFHTIRGIGMIGNNPVLSYLASGPDRGSYMTQIQIINSAVGMFCGFFIALALGRDPPLYLYSIIMAIGVVCGVCSGILMGKIPEPPAEKLGKNVSFPAVVKEAFSKESVRQFIVILFIVALVSGVSRAFIIVYSREVFRQSDGMVSLYSVFGGLGALLIGMVIKFLVDRIGAKPIFIVCVFTGLVGMIPIALMPAKLTEQFSGAMVLGVSALFFILNFGFLGSEGIAQTYFLALVPMEMMLDMGILYFLVFGVAGSAGSFLAGLLLDVLTYCAVPTADAFKVLYGILIILTAMVLWFQRKLTPLGALPFRGALEVLFSFRDLRAIALLDRLNKTKDSGEEEALLDALHGSPSQLALKGLFDRAKSPRLAVRMEALRAIEALETFDENAEKAIIDDAAAHPFTTAYLSARILGNHRVYSAIPLLRELAASADYMLAGEAIIALAKLRDEAFRPEIEGIIGKTGNPRLKIMGVEAFGIYGSPHSLTVLLDILRTENPPHYLRDETVLAMASILHIQNEFYPLLVRFLEDESLMSTLAMDEAESAAEFYRTANKGWFRKKADPSKKQAKTFLPAVEAFVKDARGAPLSRWILELPDHIVHPISQSVLSEVVLDSDLTVYDRLKLLIVHWASQQLRLQSAK